MSLAYYQMRIANQCVYLSIHLSSEFVSAHARLSGYIDSGSRFIVNARVGSSIEFQFALRGKNESCASK